MRKLLVLLGLLAVATPAAAQIAIPYTFSSGNTILSSQVNANFTALANAALNKAGDSITGNLTVSANVTIDGVDISDFLDSSGIMLANADGTNTAPAFSRVTDPNTGMYFPAADSLAWTLGGTQRLLLNASGLTVFGVNLVNSSGKIPALTSTYFTSVAFDAANLTGTAAAINGSAITNLAAVNITGAHTLNDGVLSVNVPLKDAANTFSAAQTYDLGIIVGDNKSVTSATNALVLQGATNTLVRAAVGSSVSLGDNNTASISIGAGGGTTTVTGPLSVASTLTISTKYLLLTSSTATSISTASATVDPGASASILYVDPNAGTDSIATISSGVDGRVLYVCNSDAGAVGFTFVATGNIAVASTSMSPGACRSFIYRTSISKWFTLAPA